MIDEILKQRACPYALVTLRALDGAQMTRDAALLYETADGFAWIEPSYLDPWGAASPSLHAVAANLTPTTEGFTFSGPRWSGAVEFVEDLQGDPRARGLAWYVAELERTGRSWEREREKLRNQIPERAD